MVEGEMPAVRFPSLQPGQGASTAMPIAGEFLTYSYANPEFKPWYDDKFICKTIRDEEQYFDCPDYKEDKFKNKIIKFLNNIFGKKEP